MDEIVTIGTLIGYGRSLMEYDSFIEKVCVELMLCHKKHWVQYMRESIATEIFGLN